MRIPCGTCNPCLDPNDPFQNFSAEAPDVDHVFCYGSGNGALLPGAGRNWNVGNCTITWGPVSCYATADEDCQACVESFMWECQPTNLQPFPEYPLPPFWPPTDYPEDEDTISPIIQPDPDDPDGPQIPRVIYWNTEQSSFGICPDGTFGSHFVVPAGRFAAYSQEEADLKAATYAFKKAKQRRACFNSISPYACLNLLYDEVIAVTGTITPPVHFAVTTGQIPTGIVLSDNAPVFPNTASLFGNPDTGGLYTFTITATDATGLSISKDFSIDVLGASNATTLPDCPVGTDYSTVAGSALLGIGGTGPYTFLSDPDALPDWLTVAEDGVLSGTPDGGDAGIEFSFDVIVRDANDRECVQQCSVLVSVSCETDNAFGIAGAPPIVSVTATINDWDNQKLLLSAPTADPAGGQPEWDGTLPVLDDTFAGAVSWYPAGTVVFPFACSAWATNGLFGDDCGIGIYKNGADDWQFYIYGQVGGVSTLIWSGIKSTGQRPEGTYVRNAGLSLTPAEFVITCDCTPLAAAWWSMDIGAALNATDTVNGIGLVKTNGLDAHFSIVAGHVDNGLQMTAFAGESTISVCSNAVLAFNGSGVTIALWINVTDTGPSAGNAAGISYTFDQGGISYTLTIDRTGVTPANWTARFGGVAQVAKASAAGWHFFVLTYDAVSGIIGFDIDQSGMTTQPGLSIPTGANTTGQFQCGASGDNPAGRQDVIYDEIGIYRGVLSASQLNTLYNAGVGRTWY